jgi:hypothetical protein
LCLAGILSQHGIVREIVAAFPGHYNATVAENRRRLCDHKEKT